MHKSILTLILATFFVSSKSDAQWFGKKKSNKKSSKKEQSIESKIKGKHKKEGLFDFYFDSTTGQSLIAVKKEQLGKDFIHFTYTENGVTEVGHHRGSYRGSRIIRFNRKFDKIEVVQQNTSYYFDAENPISKSANANISDAVLSSTKIIAEDTALIIISADELFLSEDLHPVKSGDRGNSKGFSAGKLSKEKTQYEQLKTYPANCDIIVRYVFDNPNSNGGASSAVTDSRYISIILQHSLIEMPDNNFQPRRDDYRIGYFTETVNDMTSAEYVNYRDLIHRWDLQKKDPNALKSEPVKPIVWWIENTTPKALIPIIKHAALEWNKAFEPLGFINAIQINVQPDSATWDAGDIRYNVLRWTSSPNPPFGGYGPSFVNPRTGEILGADIMLEYVFLTNRVKYDDIYNLPSSSSNCNASYILHHQTETAKLLLNKGFNDSSEMSRLLYESLHYLILHEMGHTLGLNHNMKASQLCNLDELRDKEFTSKNGLIGSVMDYPAINFPTDTVSVQYCQTSPGPYDLWAINYGYSIPMENAKDEELRLNQVLSESLLHEHAFGNDADDMRTPGKAIDPRVMIGDLSSDAMGFAESQVKMIEEKLELLFKDYNSQGFESYQPLVSQYSVLLGSYGTQMGVISRYIGGVFVERFTPGQTELTKPYTPVSREQQKRAMSLLREHLFNPNAINIPNGVGNYLQKQRRGFNFFGSSEEPKMQEAIQRIQENVLAHLLHPNVLARMSEYSALGGNYSTFEMLNDLSFAFFESDLNTLPDPVRQNIQIFYTEKLIKMIQNKNLSGSVKSALYNQIDYIENISRSAITDNTTNNSFIRIQLKSHREYLLHLIEQFKRK